MAKKREEVSMFTLYEFVLRLSTIMDSRGDDTEKEG